MSERPADGTCEECGDVVEARRTTIWGDYRVSPLCYPCRLRRDEAEREQRERERAERWAKRVRESAGVAGREHLTFDAYDGFDLTGSQRDALAAVRDTTESVWLWGRPGVGKTHLAVAATIAALDADADAHLWLVADLMAHLRCCQLDGSRELEAEVEAARALDLLVLDDLGVERSTAFVMETLYRIIDTRVHSGRRLIVTSNAKPSALAATLGARIHSRLVGACRVQHVQGDDGRLR